jgi:hypothetical protein
MRALVFVAVAGCHHAQAPASAAPDYHPIVGVAVPARGQLYLDCLADAVAGKHVAYAHDPATDLLLFTCSADPAHAFFDGLAGKGAEIVTGPTTLRSTNPVHRDLFGVDYCTRAGVDYTCVITLNAGQFLR